MGPASEHGVGKASTNFAGGPGERRPGDIEDRGTTLGWQAATRVAPRQQRAEKSHNCSCATVDDRRGPHNDVGDLTIDREEA